MNFIRHEYGSHSGYLHHLVARLAAAFGRYDAATRIDWPRVQRLVFVCKGNVCRSPYAEAKARSLGFSAVSCGLETSGGVPANAAALRVAQLRNIDLSKHASKLFDTSALSPNDLVLVFEPAHYEIVQQRAHKTQAQFSLVGLWPSEGVRPLITDPFGKSDQYFQACFAVIDRSLQRMIAAKREENTVAAGPGSSLRADTNVVEP
jgi:protein-tyrosine phosphatase